MFTQFKVLPSIKNKPSLPFEIKISFYAKMFIVNDHIFVPSINISGTPRHFQRCKRFTGSNSTYSHQIQIPVGIDNKYKIISN